MNGNNAAPVPAAPDGNGNGSDAAPVPAVTHGRMNGSDAAAVPAAPDRSITPAAVSRFCFHADRKREDVVRIGVIGYGHWGPNIVRNLHGIETCEVAAVCDKSPAALRRVSRVYPHVQLTTDMSEILASPEIDAVAVVTPAWTHFELAKAALLHGKHVFIEKPVTSTSQQAEELIELADRKNLKIMVDHTFLFCGAVRKIRELVDAGTLGSLYYFDSTRVNLGLFQHDVSVIWDLAPHDLSIMDHIIQEQPEAVVATGARHVNGVADLAFITMYFPNDVVAHLNLSWLSPVKVRTTLIGGTDKMLVWNDLEPDEKIRVYDKGVHITNGHNAVDALVSYRSGDVWVPKLQTTEALKFELEYFADCIMNNRRPINDGEAGLRIVRLLEAADQSLKHRGQIVYL
jgi:predicted dehydrogenase